MPTSGDRAERGPRGRKRPATTDPREPLATASQVCEFLQVPINTLYDWRKKGGGPKATRVGRELRFDWRDVDAWLAEQPAA